MSNSEEAIATVQEPTTEAPTTDEKPRRGNSDDREAVSEPRPKRRGKVRRHISRGQVHVLATFNNTIVTVTDEKGDTLSTASAGSAGFRGSKKGTAYAAQVAAEKAVEMAKTFGLSKVEVIVKGVGLGREAAIRTLVAQRINVDNIKDATGIAHGGVRPRKPKRN